ncbi:hypothetical protein M9H77_06834 [Catharanthus roseus]|uniref:Uncharacterized protein n=1 Tax=Catharanthus roseus TaxID=4058 RepID=A0ACC0BTG6_CATRO|nr:hypothetical protein M9H77_06834 [Catharanthus roseus]
MSTEVQLPTPHNEGTSEIPHSNLDPMNVIIQELQQIRKDMMDMRGNMTNLWSIEVETTMGSMSLLILNSDMNFEAQNSENEISLCYKFYKTRSFLSSIYFLSFDLIINESNSCSFYLFYDKIQSQFFMFLTTTCGTKLNYERKAKEEGMGKELTIGYEDRSISLSFNPFLLYHELCFKELKLFLEFNFPSFLDTFVRNHEAFTLLNKLLLYEGGHIQIPCDEHKPLIVDENLKTLLLGNFHGFQFYHFHFKEFMWFLICGKEKSELTGNDTLPPYRPGRPRVGEWQVGNYHTTKELGLLRKSLVWCWVINLNIELAYGGKIIHHGFKRSLDRLKVACEV